MRGRTKIIVMGGGVIGVTTAYWLAKSGHEVVLERNGGFGEETSFRTRALLAPGHSQSWAAPGGTLDAFQIDIPERSGIEVPLQQRSAVLALGDEVPRQLHARRLSRQYASRAALHDGGLDRTPGRSASETGVGYNGNDRGILYLFRTVRSFEERHGDWTLLREHGLKLEEADADRCAAVEPARAGQASDRWRLFAGRKCGRRLRLYAALPNAAAPWASASRSTPRCAPSNAMATGYGPCIRTKVRSPLMHFSWRRALFADPPAPDRPQPADLAGEGYTASIPIGGHRGAPKVGIIEEDNLVAFANLGDTLRVGGKAEFTGYDTSYAEADFQGIMSVSRELFRMPATTAGRAIGPAYGR